MEQKMYGSTHTHFEDLFDTANDKKQMVCEFASLGAKRVAVTGHGTMFAYEDLKAIVAACKENKTIPEDFEIIPGVEVYFEDEARHMVLVAENYAGYQQLCRVVTESAHNTQSKKSSAEEDEFLTPIVTMENLQKHIGSNPGNVYMTTACVGGVFAKPLALDDETYKKEIAKAEKKLEEILKQAGPARRLLNEWDRRVNDPENKKLLKKDRMEWDKAVEENDTEKIAYFEKRQKNFEETDTWKKENAKLRDKAKNVLSKYEAARVALEQATEAYDAYKQTYQSRFEAAKELYGKLSGVFGKDKIYFELQNHGLAVEEEGYNRVIELAYEVEDNPQFITSNDVHIGDRKGSDTWEQSVLKRRVEMFNRFKNIYDRPDEEEYGIKTDEEIRDELLKIVKPCKDRNGVEHSAEEIVDSAIENIKKAMEPCKVEFPKIGLNADKGEINFYPKFCEDEVAKFKEEVEKGISWRFPKGLPEGYRERIDYEMGVICSMGYAGYHLIVKDYIEYGRLLGCLRTQEEIDNAPLSIEGLNRYIDENNIPRVGMGVGPGRGSAAGSLCAYLLGITDVDPIPYDLMFERFLNPSRHSMPDIDTDFKDDIRERLYEYIKARYGEECVSKVCTKAEAHGKAAAGIASRYLATLEGKGLDKPAMEILKSEYVSALSRVSKMITRYMKENDLPATKVENGTKAAKALFEERKNDPDNSEEFRKEQAILEMTGKIAGIPSNVSMHACACLISGTPLSDVIPLAWNDAKQKMTTQCLYPQAEELGLLKMDLLNIKNLTVITKVMQSAREMGVLDDKLLTPEGVQELLVDPRIYSEIFSSGRTLGVFQFESDGMTKMLKDFKPECFEDIVLLVAAYRPGPLSFLPEVISEKWWRKRGVDSPYGEPNHRIKIQDEKLKAILEPTYGVPIYQEQIMKIVQQLAGYNMADADNVRKYMSKKKEKLLEKERGFFVYGSDYVISKTNQRIAELGALEHPTDEQVKEKNQLEADVKKMPTYIKGCVPNGVCSAEEANDLFDAMMDFGKYAFNKSHALCYAQVAMYTAYQKLYFPELFYKYTLSNETKDGPDAKTKRMATEKYIDEMKTFGIELLPPSPVKSFGDYVIEDGNIRTGFGCIKGSSYVDYKNADNVLMFIAKNPDISISQVTVFAKLGMFEKIFPTNKSGNAAEIARVGGNRDAIVKWIEEYGDDAKEFGHLNREILELKEKIRVIESSGNTDEMESVKITLADREERFSILKEAWNTMIQNASPCPPREKKDSINDRIFEHEKIGVAFSAREDLELLKKYATSETIASIEAKRDPSLRGYSAPKATIAATVVSKTENTTGKGPSFKYTLMDQNGDTIQVASWDKVDQAAEITCGKFTISYGQYTNLDRNGVKPFDGRDISNITADKSKFNANAAVEVRNHPVSGKPMEFQRLQAEVAESQSRIIACSMEEEFSESDMEEDEDKDDLD